MKRTQVFADAERLRVVKARKAAARRRPTDKYTVQNKYTAPDMGEVDDVLDKIEEVLHV
jgi:hypothetical protein